MSNIVANSAGTLNKAAPAQSGIDSGSIATVLSIIVVAGILGGLAAFLARSPDVEKSESWRISLARYILLGVVAAACAPLFLTLVQSDLVKRLFEGVSRRPFAEYLVFLGFCLIAAFSARTFLESISRRVLRDIENVKDEQQNIQQAQEVIQQQVQETAELVDDQRGKTTPQPAPQRAVETAVDPTSLPQTTHLERQALRAMAAVGFRTSLGIADDMGMTRSQVEEILASLADKGLAHQRESATTNVMRWEITPKGSAVLNRVVPAAEGSD